MKTRARERARTHTYPDHQVSNEHVLVVPGVLDAGAVRAQLHLRPGNEERQETMVREAAHDCGRLLWILQQIRVHLFVS